MDSTESHFHPWGSRRVDPLHDVLSEGSQSASTRGGLSARSPIDTTAATWPRRHTCGAIQN